MNRLFTNSLQAVTEDLLCFTPSVKAEAFMRGVKHDKSEAEACKLFNFFSFLLLSSCFSS